MQITNHKFSQIEITQLPILKDNYAYILKINSTYTIIDPGEATPVINFLKRQNLRPRYIINTHHHWDHTDGNLEIQEEFECEIWGPGTERIPGKTKELFEGPFEIAGLKGIILNAPGHTLGHVIIYFPTQNILFTGDVLFCGGCGRIFEGSMSEMFTSLQKIKNLPHKTQIFCGHEYSLKNIEFGKTVGISNLEPLETEWKMKIKNKIPTVPTTLEVELKINPFLRAKDVDEFSRLRILKDNF